MVLRHYWHNGKYAFSFDGTGDQKEDWKLIDKICAERGIEVKSGSRLNMMMKMATGSAGVAKLLWNEKAAGRDMMLFLDAPFSVNAAFAMELYLKTLAFKYGAEARGHELAKLFDELPGAARDAIEAVTPSVAVKHKFRAPEDHIDPHLRQLNGAFVDWRYGFESGNVPFLDVGAALFVIDVLHSACLVGGLE
jgi:hypothetical protein